jgi:hypothetical protein
LAWNQENLASSISERAARRRSAALEAALVPWYWVFSATGVSMADIVERGERGGKRLGLLFAPHRRLSIYY